jgi:hypothetical protein
MGPRGRNKTIARSDNCQKIQIENPLCRRFGQNEIKRSEKQFRRFLAILAVLAIVEKDKNLEDFKDDAKKRTRSQKRSDRGPDLQLNAGDQVCERHDVGRQEIHRAGNFL